MSQFVHGPTRYFTPSAAISQYSRVVLASDGTISAAGLADQSIGVAEEAAYTTGTNPLRPIAVRLNTAEGTRKMIAAAAIAKGAVAYGAASGKVSGTASGSVEGIVISDAGANNDICEVMYLADDSAASAGIGGVAAGYIVARGETALDGSNPTPVTTGLTTIVSFVATLKGSAAPGVGTSILTYTTSAGTASVYAWKVTATGDATLVASTGTETFGWVAVGT